MNYFDFSQIRIEPIPMLAALRDAVLSRSDKRMPKWQFRLADDIVTRIQPKTAKSVKANRNGKPWFDCLAIIHPDASAAMLQAKDPPKDAWKLGYRLTLFAADKWIFQPTRLGYDQTCLNDDRNRLAYAIRDRVVSTLPIALAHLNPGLMLQPSCLMCGKAMTDPVSMARWIGPDCAHTTSAAVPFMVILSGSPQNN